MKKKMILSLCAAAAAALMSVNAFAGEVTLEEVLANFSASSKEATEFVCDVDMKADISIDLPDMDSTFGMGGEGSMNIACTTDPINVGSTGSFNASAMGEQFDVDFQMYAVTEEDGSLGTYIHAVANDEDTGWQYDALPAEDAAQILEMAKSINVDWSQMPINFTLGDGTVDVEGHDCYQLLSTMTGAEIIDLFKYAMEMAAQTVGEELSEELPTDQLDMIAPMLTGLVINMEIDVDSTEYLPMRMHMDLEGSDWTILGAVFAQYADLTNDDGTLMNVSIDVPALYIDYLYDYDAAVEISVPAEAIAAKAAAAVE